MIPEGGRLQLLCMPTKRTRSDEAIQTFHPAYQYLCPVDYFTHYLLLTEEKRALQDGISNNLFTSYIKPYHPITRATVAH